jgi:hypothetical protein
MLRFLFDVHVPFAVANQLGKRGIDILTAQADSSATLLDCDLLARATQLGRTVVTSDIRFRVLAESWRQQERAFCGLVFAHPLHVTIGQMVLDLELIATAVSEEEMRNQVVHLPL